MFYQNTQLLNHQQSVLTVFFAKTHIFYLLCSCLFWVIAVGIGWIQYFDPFIGDSYSLYRIDSLLFGAQFCVHMGTILFISLFVGTLLSLPAIMTKGILNFFILYQRKKYKKVFYLVFVAQYLPYILLILTNIFFYYANLSPKIYTKILSFERMSALEKTYQFIGRKNPLGNYLFLVPSSLLDDKTKLIKTKEILSYSYNILLESTAKAEIVAQIAQIENNQIAKYYAPTFIGEKPVNTNKNEKIFLGIDYKHIPQFLNVFTNNVIPSKRFRLTKKTLLSNRSIAYLKPIRLVVELNMFGWLNANWKKEAFNNTSGFMLMQYAKKLKNEPSAEYNFLFLTDLEPSRKDDLLLASSDFFSTQEREKFSEKLDLNIFNVIKALQASGVNNIYLVPYQTEHEGLKLSKIFSAKRINTELKSYRTLLNSYENFTCKNQFIYDQKISGLNQSILLSGMKFKKNGYSYLPDSYEFYIQRFFTNTLFCYEHGDEENDIYVIMHKEENADVFARPVFAEEKFNIYKIQNNKPTPYLLTTEEKRNFLNKYANEILKSN